MKATRSIKTHLLRRIRRKREAQSELSLNLNIGRQALSVGQDFIRIIGLSISLFADLFRFIRLPLQTINLCLQWLVVLHDKNFPPTVKAITLALISGTILLASTVWMLAPTLSAGLLALTVVSHAVTLFYRANKLQVNVHQYLTQPELHIEEADALLMRIINKYRSLKTLISFAEKNAGAQELVSDVEQYCKMMDQDYARRFRWNRIVENTLGVLLLITRGIAATLLLTIAVGYSALAFPLILVSLGCNLGDLIRNSYGRFQVEQQQDRLLHQQMVLVNNIETYTQHYTESADEQALARFHAIEPESNAQKTRGIRFFTETGSLVACTQDIVSNTPGYEQLPL